MKTSEAQLKASAKWDAENKEKKKFIWYRSKAKKFIKDFASNDDLDKLDNLIKERRRNNGN